MADPPDLAPNKRAKCVVTLHLPPEVLKRGLTTKTKQPRKDGKPRRKKLGRPRNVSIQAQQEAEAARRHREQVQTTGQAQSDEDELDDLRGYIQTRNAAIAEGQGPAKPQLNQPLLYPPTQAQRRAARENEEALRIWRENEPTPLRFEPSRNLPQDFTNLSPNTVPLHFGSDHQRQLLQGAWDTIHRIERKFGTLQSETNDGSDWQNSRQGRVAVDALQQSPEQQAQERYYVSPAFFQPQPVRPPTAFLANARQGFGDPEGYGVPVNSELAMNTNSSLYTAPHSLNLGPPHAHPVQQQSYAPLSASQYQTGYAPQSHRPAHQFPHVRQPYRPHQQSYNSFPTAPLVTYQPQTPTPAPRIFPHPHPRPQRMILGHCDTNNPDYHYTVNLTHNLHCPNPLHLPSDPATKLDYSYLILNNLRTKQANSIDPQLHLHGGCGELHEIAPREGGYEGYGCAEPRVGAGIACPTDNMDLHINSGIGIGVPNGVDDASYDITDVVDFDAGVDSIIDGDGGHDGIGGAPPTSDTTTGIPNDPALRKPRTILLPLEGVEAAFKFKWDILLSTIRLAATQMKRTRLSRASVRANMSRLAVHGVHWAAETRGPFIEDDDDIGAYPANGEDKYGMIHEKSMVKFGYRKEQGGREGKGEGDWQGNTVEELHEEDRGSGGSLKAEFEQQMEMSDPWRGVRTGKVETEEGPGEYGFSVGGEDVVFGVVHVDTHEVDEDGRDVYRGVEPQI